MVKISNATTTNTNTNTTAAAARSKTTTKATATDVSHSKPIEVDGRDGVNRVAALDVGVDAGDDDDDELHVATGAADDVARTIDCSLSTFEHIISVWFICCFVCLAIRDRCCDCDRLDFCFFFSAENERR